MKLSQKLTTKAKLNQTLRSWLPILQASSDELKEILEPFLEKNPFAQIEPNPKSRSLNFYNDLYKTSISDTIESSIVYKESLYEKLYRQIDDRLFPSKRSKEIANLIIESISDEGYFEWDDEILAAFSPEKIESVRLKFSQLEPVGVGAKDYKESLLWQLDDLCGVVGCDADEILGCDEYEAYSLARTLISHFDELGEYTDETHYDEAMGLIKRLKNPPAMEFMAEAAPITPDLVVSIKGGEISITLSDDFYPEICIDTDGLDEKMDFVAAYIKEAKDLIDALSLRKATLYKIGLMIIEYQYDYFFGGAIKRMKLKDIAADLGRSASTISRAIANKYLQSPRGTEPLKSFFASEVGDEEVSNAALKDFVRELVKGENHAKPLSDEAILLAIKEKFGIELVRRTITKYRKALNIAGSSERKKLYAMASG